MWSSLRRICPSAEARVYGITDDHDDLMMTIMLFFRDHVCAVLY